MTKKMTREQIHKMVLTGILAGLVMIAAFFPLRIGTFQIALGLIPIIIGGAICGPLAGGFLGLVFGAFNLFDAGLFLAFSVPGTVVTCLLKGTLAGFASGLLYKALARITDNNNASTGRNMLRVFLAGAACPIVNTGVFAAGCYLFFFSDINEWALANGFGSATEAVFIGFIGINFLVELATVSLLSPMIERLVRAGAQIRKKR